MLQLHAFHGTYFYAYPDIVKFFRELGRWWNIDAYKDEDRHLANVKIRQSADIPGSIVMTIPGFNLSQRNIKTHILDVRKFAHGSFLSKWLDSCKSVHRIVLSAFRDLTSSIHSDIHQFRQDVPQSGGIAHSPTSLLPSYQSQDRNLFFQART